MRISDNKDADAHFAFSYRIVYYASLRATVKLFENFFSIPYIFPMQQGTKNVHKWKCL